MGDKAFREKTIKEIPVAAAMLLWNWSPYRYYFILRWYEKNLVSDHLTSEEKKEYLEDAIRAISKAINFQPTRSLFWTRLGYLLYYCSSLSEDYHFSFPGTDQATRMHSPGPFILL